MKRMLKWIGTVVSLLFLTYIIIYSGPAKAFTFNSACGAEATGKLGRLSRECWTADYRGSCFGREVTRAKPRWHVDLDGYWVMCPPGVKDGQKVIADCPRTQLTRWFKAEPGFKGGWYRPSVAYIPRGDLGAMFVVKSIESRWCTRTFECGVLPDGTTGWIAMTAGCKRP